MTTRYELLTDRPILDDSVQLVDEGVLILDRRVFPAREEWVLARSAGEVAEAIRAMVTQSSGPFYAALAALSLTARDRRDADATAARAALQNAGRRLTAARPTNNHVRDAVRDVLAAVDGARPSTGAAVAAAVEGSTRGAGGRTTGPAAPYSAGPPRSCCRTAPGC